MPQRNTPPAGRAGKQTGKTEKEMKKKCVCETLEEIVCASCNTIGVSIGSTQKPVKVRALEDLMNVHRLSVAQERIVLKLIKELGRTPA